MNISERETTWDEVEKEIVLIESLVRRLPDEEKGYAAVRIAMAAVLWAGGTFYEQIGILEEAKLQHREIYEKVMGEEDDD